jgi:hypothetical protein
MTLHEASLHFNDKSVPRFPGVASERILQISDSATQPTAVARLPGCSWSRAFFWRPIARIPLLFLKEASKLDKVDTDATVPEGQVGVRNQGQAKTKTKPVPKVKKAA